MTQLRSLRYGTGLSQEAFAALLEVPLNTFRMWDGGLRMTPADLLVRAQQVVVNHHRRHELLSLDALVMASTGWESVPAAPGRE